MNNEIKINTIGQLLDFVETEEKAKELIDYITNLQKYYNDNVNKYEELLLKYSNLQGENERLKEQKEHLLIDLEGESEYKVMCEKAIEYIKEHNCIATNKEYKPTQFEYCCNVDLLNILGDKDE